MLCVPAFAVDVPLDGYPTFKSGYDDGSVLIYKTGDTLFGYSFDHNVNSVIINYSGELVASCTPKTNFKFSLYRLDAGDINWSLINHFSESNSTTTMRVGNVVYSDLDIYNSDGDLFFPPPPKPLSVTALGVAQEILEVDTVPTIQQVLLILALCGVGCLVLLISLPLLKRVFRIFLH